MQFDNRTSFHGRDKNKSQGWLGEYNAKRQKEGYAPLLLSDYAIEDIIEPEPIESCVYSAKRYIQRITEKLNCGKYKIYIGKGSTFRHQIILPKGRRYKENREKNIKPFHHQAVEDYLVNEHGAEFVEDIEVDDKLSMLSYETYQHFLDTGIKNYDTNIIVSRDKDTAGTQGWWYNPDHGEDPVYIHGLGMIYLNEKREVKGTGRLFKYYQLLVGDDSDGYAAKKTPIHTFQYGDVGAFKDLSRYTTDKECWEFIVKKYKEWMPDEVTYLAWNGNEETDNWLSWLQKHLELVHMRRWMDDKPSVKRILQKLDIDFRT